MTYASAGDLGDVIWSLPTVRALGGGDVILHAERWTREPMSDRKVASLNSLLQAQPYICNVRWRKQNEVPDVNLNDFRSEYFRTFRHQDFPKHRNLCEWILRTHGCDIAEQDKRWLDVEPFRVAPVIINRTGAGRQASQMYRNLKFPWRRIVDTYKNQIAFVGTPSEHDDFVQHFGMVPHFQTATLLDLAQVIAGADLFIGNQSCAYAIAEGLKKSAILEVCPWLPNCLFIRPDVIHGWDANIDLPPIQDTYRSGWQNVSGESVPMSKGL